MADGDPSATPGADQGADQGAAPTPPQGAQGPPPGGGPVLAGIAAKQRAQQVSAPGPGDTAQSMSMVSQAVSLLQQAMTGFTAGSPQHRDVLRAISSLSRHMAQGQPTAGQQRTQLQDMMQNMVKNALLSRIMQQQRGGQGGAGGADQAQAPMPATPTPGA